MKQAKNGPICLWSGPRNVSTALMYSMAELDDIRVVDEPLYGHYLAVSGADHPGRDEVMASMNCDANSVMDDLIAQQLAEPRPRLFLKHMAHHLVDLDLGFLQQTVNVILIRDPREMLPSLSIQLPQAKLADTGLQRQWELYKWLQTQGQPPVVLDSRELLLNPAHVLQTFCDATGLDYSPQMLSWDAGARTEDGVWAKYWYHAVHKSTGFAPYRGKTDFPERLLPLLRECQPWYEKLYAHAIRNK